MRLATAKTLEIEPIIIEGDRAQVKQRLSTGFGPAHAGLFKAVFDQMPTGAFDDTRANRPAKGQIALVIHIRTIAAEISAKLGQHGLLRSGSVVGLSRQELE